MSISVGLYTHTLTDRYEKVRVLRKWRTIRK